MAGHAVVVGAGIVGASVALELVRRGWTVSVLEREAEVGVGSTARSSTVIRCHYTRREAIALAHEGQKLWSDWASFTGLETPRAEYHPSGVLFLLRRGGGGPPSESLGMKAEMDQADLDARLEAMLQLGVDAELLGPEQLRARFPSLRFAEDNAVATWEKGSGYVYPATGAVEDLRAAGEEEGVVYRLSTHLVSGSSAWLGNARNVQSVTVDGPDGTRTLDCDVVVNCAGPNSHAVNLAMDCPLPLTTAPQRQFIIEGTWANPDGLKVPAMADLVNGFYMRPDQRQFKVGAVLPMDHVDFTQDPEASGWQERASEFEERLLAGLAQRVPGIELQEVETKVAFYDWTVSDSYPLLGATDVQGYYVAIGTSGAWFKAGPVIGELMAALVDRRQAGDTGTVFRLSRSGNDLDLAHFAVRRR